MFYRIKNNEIFDFADYKYKNDCLQTSIITTKELDDDRRKVIVQDGELILNPDYETEKAQEEQDRINKLTMTALDFIGFLQDAGLTLEQINAYLQANLAVKMQLTYCQNVYCGVAKSLMPITFEDITITADMVEIAFRIKNGETIDEDNSTGEASDEISNEDETSSNPPVDNNEEIEE